MRISDWSSDVCSSDLISGHIRKSSYGGIVVLLGVFATSLFYGDSMITPAVSVLSAVEGLTVVESRLAALVVPIALILLIGLFVLQKRDQKVVLWVKIVSLCFDLRCSRSIKKSK